MFRFFENLVDPYRAYVPNDTPEKRLWPFLREYVIPFKFVFLATGSLSVMAASFDVFLIWYLGRVIDLLSNAAPPVVWNSHGSEIIAMALVVLILRPIIISANVALLHNTILPNFGTMIRYRAHSHVLRQPVGWFESDFAGRLANRIMQTPPAAGDAVFQTFDAMAFSAVTV